MPKKVQYSKAKKVSPMKRTSTIKTTTVKGTRKISLSPFENITEKISHLTVTAVRSTSVNATGEIILAEKPITINMKWITTRKQGHFILKNYYPNGDFKAIFFTTEKEIHSENTDYELITTQQLEELLAKIN